MKKLLLSLTLIGSLFASDMVLPSSQAMSILKKTPLYSQVAPRLKTGLKIKGVEKKDFYIITVYDKKGEGNFFVTKDFKYTILGNIINNQTKKPVIANYPAKPFTGNKQIVKDGVLFSFGSGHKDLYIVTDPECPWCRKFEEIAKNTNFGSKYKIHIIFLPLQIHKDSKAMIDYIMSAKNEKEKAKRFHATLQGSDAWKKFKPTKQEKLEIEAELKKSKKAVDELGARGTPSFYDENMTEIKDKENLFK